jgi:hypothetical protein
MNNQLALINFTFGRGLNGDLRKPFYQLLHYVQLYYLLGITYGEIRRDGGELWQTLT